MNTTRYLDCIYLQLMEAFSGKFLPKYAVQIQTSLLN